MRFFKTVAACGIAHLILLACDSLADPGDVDASFDPGTGANLQTWCVAAQPDNKVLVGGVFTSINGISRKKIARLNADGSVDGDFDPGVGPDRTVWAVAVQADGKVLIGGEFTTIDGVTRTRIGRLNANGSLDTSFTASADSGAVAVYSIVLQPDGKAVLGGYFSSINGSGRRCIARLNSDGTVDSSFLPGGGANSQVSSLAPQSDGKIIIGGYFTTVNWTNRNRIARLNSDGSLDLTFDPGTGADMQVNSVVAQSDGKIVIGGDFTEINGTSRYGIARLNPDGGLDFGFDPSRSGFIGSVESVAVQPDGKVLIGGIFAGIGSTGQNRVARLNADGSLDTTFNSGTGPNSFVSCLALCADGDVLIGGAFTTINGISRRFIGRLRGNPVLNIQPGNSAAVLTWPTNQTGFTLQSAVSLNPPIAWVDATNVPVVSSNQFLVIATNAQGSGFFRLSK